MDGRRREVLKAGGSAACSPWRRRGDHQAGDASPQEWNKAAFETKNVAETVKRWAAADDRSSAIEITAPDIGDGAVVPTRGEQLPKTQAIAS